MTILAGLSFAFIAYPFALRINQWTDKEGLQTYKYTLVKGNTWEPESTNYSEAPVIKINEYSKYWNQYNIGDIKKYELRKGGLGFYQLNMKPIYKEQREFYENNTG